MRKFVLGIFCVMTLIACGGAAVVEPTASDWTAFRGPAADGVYQGTDWDYTRLEAPDAQLWMVQVGMGFSAPSILGDRLYVAGLRQGQEHMYCLNAVDGSELWSFDYTASDSQLWPGTRSSALLMEGRVFFTDREGGVYCLKANDGGLVWRSDLTDIGYTDPGWGIASTPVAYGDLLLVTTNQYGAALNRATGEIVWASPAGDTSYASPVIVESNGRTVAIFLSARTVTAVEPETGTVVWSHPWLDTNNINAASPVFFDDKLFVTTGYNYECILLDLAPNSPVELWRNRNVESNWQTAMYYDGLLYADDGMGGNNFSSDFRCIDPADGSILWTQPLGFGNFIRAQDKFILVNEVGRITIFTVNPAYEQLAQIRLEGSNGQFWTAPVLAHGFLYVRTDAGRLFCFDLRAE